MKRGLWEEQGLFPGWSGCRLRAEVLVGVHRPPAKVSGWWAVPTLPETVRPGGNSTSSEFPAFLLHYPRCVSAPSAPV